MKKVIGTIELDGDKGRAEVYWEDGRIWCDGNDITPSPDSVTFPQAVADVVAMYDNPTWDLRLDACDNCGDVDCHCGDFISTLQEPHAEAYYDARITAVEAEAVVKHPDLAMSMRDFWGDGNEAE